MKKNIWSTCRIWLNETPPVADVAFYEAVCVLESRSRFVLKWKRRSPLLRRPPSYFFLVRPRFRHTSAAGSVKVSIEVVVVFAFLTLSKSQDPSGLDALMCPGYVCGICGRVSGFGVESSILVVPMVSLPVVDNFQFVTWFVWSALIFFGLLMIKLCKYSMSKSPSGCTFNWLNNHFNDSLNCNCQYCDYIQLHIWSNICYRYLYPLFTFIFSMVPFDLFGPSGDCRVPISI